MSNLEKEILRFLSTVEKASSSEIAAVLQQSVSQRVLATLLMRLERLGKIKKVSTDTIKFKCTE